MPRLFSSHLAVFRRFARERRGATAVEFALLAAPMMILLFGIIELAMILLVSATLDMATDFSARNIRTGVFQTTGGVTKADFEALVCRNMVWLKPACEGDKTKTNDKDGRLFVEARTFGTFAEVNNLISPAPKDFDPDKVCWTVGNPEDIVVVTTYFRWPIITPLMRPMFQNYEGGRLVSSTRLFRNEPYDAAKRPQGTKCN